MHAAFDLNCCILGDYNPLHAKESVGILQKTIKDKKHVFEHVDADTLVLWNVSIPVDENFRESSSKHDFERRLLGPARELVEIFTEPPAKKHVHIVIKVPPIFGAFE